MGLLGKIIGGVADIAGSVIGASSKNKAAKKAAKAEADAAEKNNALTREIYGQNKDIIAPYAQRGGVAGDYINAFLGLPQAPPPPPSPAAVPVTGPYTPATSGPMGTTAWNQPTFDIPGYGAVTVPTGTQPIAPTQPAGVSQQDAQDAFRRYITNSDYGFQFGQGANSVNSGYAGAGTVLSGAAMKGLEGFRQNLQGGYRQQWLGNLGNQQGVGLSGASALAGVGQNMVNTISANNQNAADAAANAALIKGNNNPFAAGLGALSGGGLLKKL